MKILSLDTAMAACSAAVLDTESALPLAAAFRGMDRGHAEALAPMVSEVMRGSGVGFHQIDRIAVTTGPGTFTGVRIGLAFARGLGLARGIPVIGIDSLTAIAMNETAETPLLVVSDARNGEVYTASFDAARRRLSEPHITSMDSAAEGFPDGGLIIGTAKQSVLAASGRGGLALSQAGDTPVAAHFGALAAGMRAGAMPSPLYLRAPDAKPQAAPLRKAGDLSFETASVTAGPVMAALHAEAFDEGWTAGAFEDLLRMPGALGLIALELGEPVAFLLARTAADEAEIITIGTRPGAQRRGVARRLLEHGLAALSARGLRQVFLEVAASNPAAQNLYAALGFREAGRRKGYYRRKDSVEDAVVMRLELRP